nr:ATP-grasp domain-containing protein [uncultured Acetatifactor sp.]
MREKMQNVLVFPCGSEIAFEIYQSLKNSKHFRLIGANSVSDHGRFVYENYIPNIPFVSDTGFICAIKQIVKEYNINYIYPSMDYAIAVLKENEELLGCSVIASPKETTQICLSKKRTYEFFSSIVPTPQIYSIEEDFSYPVFCKPDIGYGSRGAYIIKNREMLETYLGEYPDALVMEYLPGSEYTVDCFTNRDGVLLFCGARTRNRISKGISVNTSTIKENTVFRDMAEHINHAVRFRGAWFMQLKRNVTGELVLLEVASRLGGSSALYRARGINFAQLSLFDAMGLDVSIIDNGYDVEMDRAFNICFKIDINYDEVFIDYDDTIILEKNKYNLEAIKFLYQCKNRKIKVTLLTMHDGNLENELKQFQLTHLFDRVIHIGRKDNKSLYIDNIHSIFIDDSFRERKQVQEKMHIPVFSVDMIGYLA